MTVCVSILFLFSLYNIVVFLCVFISHWCLYVCVLGCLFVLTCCSFLPSLPSVECWRGRVLGGDGQGSHRLVPL